jgi:hypothetical protein
LPAKTSGGATGPLVATAFSPTRLVPLSLVTVDVGGADEVPTAGDEAGAPPEDWIVNSLIRSTMAGSRLAKALSLTSSPQLRIRSNSSGLLRPSSFANSWTRVDKGDSSAVGFRLVGIGTTRLSIVSEIISILARSAGRGKPFQRRINRQAQCLSRLHHGDWIAPASGGRGCFTSTHTRPASGALPDQTVPSRRSARIRSRRPGGKFLWRSRAVPCRIRPIRSRPRPRGGTSRRHRGGHQSRGTIPCNQDRPASRCRAMAPPGMGRGGP